MITRKIDGENMLFFDGDTKALSMCPTLDEEEGTVKVEVEGDIRRELSTMFQDELASFLSAGIDVETNFEKVTYISYAAMIGMLELQSSAEKSKLTFKLKGLRGDVLEKFKSVGFDQLLDIE